MLLMSQVRRLPVPCARNQDYELNWLLRKRGETAWFDPSAEVR